MGFVNFSIDTIRDQQKVWECFENYLKKLQDFREQVSVHWKNL